MIGWLGEYLMKSGVDVDADEDAGIIIKNGMYNYVNCYNKLHNYDWWIIVVHKY